MKKEMDLYSEGIWQEVKPPVRKYESELIGWHWDHSKGRNGKGINLLTAFYHTQLLGAAESLRVPVAFECVKKTVRLELSAEDFGTLYKKRRSVEEYHKSLKQNIS
jgi:hypothetical protein